MNRTCTLHTLTHTRFTALINPMNDPPDKPSQSPYRVNTRIISHLLIHLVQSLRHLLRIYRIKSLATYIELFRQYPPPFSTTQPHT
jgi:hypothetical protein